MLRKFTRGCLHWLLVSGSRKVKGREAKHAGRKEASVRAKGAGPFKLLRHKPALSELAHICSGPRKAGEGNPDLKKEDEVKRRPGLSLALATPHLPFSQTNHNAVETFDSTIALCCRQNKQKEDNLHHGIIDSVRASGRQTTLPEGDTEDKKPDIPTLADVNLSIPKGSLVMIIGKVGSGKSTLLSSMINEIPFEAGHVQLNGTAAYCAQLPWIQVCCHCLTSAVHPNQYFYF